MEVCFGVFDEISLKLHGGLDLEHTQIVKPETRKMQGRCDADMLGGIRHNVKKGMTYVRSSFASLPFMVTSRHNLSSSLAAWKQTLQ